MCRLINPLLSPGDPAGIGSEISLRAWQAGRKNIVLQGDIDHLGQIADALELAIPFTEYDAASFARTHQATCHVIHDKWATDPISGSPDPAHARQIITAIETAVRHAKGQAIFRYCHQPYCKNNLYQAGFLSWSYRVSGAFGWWGKAASNDARQSTAAGYPADRSYSA